MNEQIRHALRKPTILAAVLVYGSILPLGLGAIILWAFDWIDSNVRGWLGVGLIMALPFFASSVVAIGAGAFVFVRHVLRDIFAVGKWSS